MTTARSSRGLALLGLVAALGAQAAPAPRLALEQQTIEFGEVILGQSATFSVGFTNAGDAPLELTEVEPSCGCTVSEFPRAPIAPGGKGTLSFRFDSARRLGPQALTVKIYSNDPTANELGQGCTILHLRGEVRSLFRLRPAGAFFGEWVRGSELAARVIHVVGVDEAKGKALGHALSAELPDYLQASAKPWTSPEGEPGVEVEVRLLPDAPLGDLEARVVLETGLATQPEVEIPVIAVVSGRVGAPTAVQFERMARGWGGTRRVPLERRDGGQGLGVLALEFDEALFTLKREPINPGRLDLVVTVRDDAPPGIFARRLRVHLDDPVQPVLDVALFGEVLPKVQVDPPLLEVTPGAPAELRVKGGEVLEARLEPQTEGATVELVPGEGGEYRVRVELPAAAGDPPRLVLVTRVAGEERVEVSL
ncbi:MAG: DUF1573 domain-containing protein, partial [Planctomycetes bacterium]|nr:DUF1573 domain-containing protein [Planctomycetota bacterium]